MRKAFFTLAFLFSVLCAKAEDGHSLWLRYNQDVRHVDITVNRDSKTINLAVEELQKGWKGMPVSLVVAKPNKKQKSKNGKVQQLSPDAFTIETVNKAKQEKHIKISSQTDAGILYGVFHLLRLQQTGKLPADMSWFKVSESPVYQHRILNHWDNLDGTVERGYAGHSIFWHDNEAEPTFTDDDAKLWAEYGRANASVGINGTVVNNVNASPKMLSKPYIDHVCKIADVLRPYGMKVYISINFSSPKELGGLPTSDPLNADVKKWWKKKADEIYKLIPDFGGFLVKANSEGLPGPQDFGRTHADGANMLADVLKPHGGIVMWRAFVYKSDDSDRAKQAYQEFMPLDGQFRDNVIIQIKNGPIDFQPREPFSPLFGALKKTQTMIEFQITQEYLGHSFQLCYLAPMWQECLMSDTYQKGEGTTIARVTDGKTYPQKYTAIAGVANVGRDTNWCGHIFAQSNWYAFGRLAWNCNLDSKDIAEEWIAQTFCTDKEFVQKVESIMMDSREAVVNYMMPLGLHHLFAWTHHYGPEPWCEIPGARADWLPSYYHKASEDGIGFDRSSKGTNAVSQYHEPLSTQFDNVSTCPDEYLLWFHHLPWDYKMQNGETLWSALCHKYDKGVKQVRNYQVVWDGLEKYVDADRFKHVQSKLRRQAHDAVWWRDACLLYFQQYSKMPLPSDVERPVKDLDEYKQIKFRWSHHN